jgi:Ser/Thr protein kinase RdoA (MazF antagonist)
VVIAPGPRGALGRIWRVDADGARYALKETFFEPPSEPLVQAEVRFVGRALAANVRAPRTHPDRAGRHLVSGPDGTWLRLYDWVPTSPLDLASPATPAQLGELLARLHRCAPAAQSEPVGGPPDPWYEVVLAAQAFEPALRSGAAWVPRLAQRVAALPELGAVASPVDPARLLLCHRDLHPGNVLADASGTPVVVDWDNLGPADPARELARALFDWWCDPTVDAAPMRGMYEAYVHSDGPARVTQPGDFTMLIASRLNFLVAQLAALLDERTSAEHRGWAEQEVDEALRIFPTPAQLSEVLGLVERIG